ncbi:hypothetical protein [Candidatus Viridilinea mediisalina]|uniref:Type I restriction enzyme R protein N-terminal domain-containing protein n=1 Tax=Candidatus Viridilinea mediisalina TaxID=2024553 RepID=A0A2A6RER9_9CHLR|nr:hypothetical protein [Candidatus Viridilinea mediisalina]PDW01393.1 hypothetical protein CJ255_19165 [Candidatus Viridilinea mediisalina]
MPNFPLANHEELTFTDYFKLKLDLEAVVAHFGYSLAMAQISLPQTTQAIPWYADLHQRIQSSMPYISLTSEAARREFLIAPILLDLARYHQIKIKVEFPLEVSRQLRGSLDYYLQATHTLLIIEAKHADLQRGFTQLAAELIALDQWNRDPYPTLYGAVSIGNVWQFGLLAREPRQITQDLNLYRVPADLQELLAILLGILTEDG